MPLVVAMTNAVNALGGLSMEVKMELIIQTRDLRKSFGGFEALRGISLEVPTGSIYGFVGPNGAGKTTTMRILTTLTQALAGAGLGSGTIGAGRPAGGAARDRLYAG